MSDKLKIQQQNQLQSYRDSQTAFNFENDEIWNFHPNKTNESIHEDYDASPRPLEGH